MGRLAYDSPMTATPKPLRAVSLLESQGETAGQRNALLLIQLRWLAVFGQAFTIVFSVLQFGLVLPLPAMFGVIAALVLLNLASMLRPRRNGEVTNTDLFLALLVDFTALTLLLYFSGGASNPFLFLYLLQVTLGVILLEPRSAWILTGLSITAAAVLAVFNVPLQLPEGTVDELFRLYVLGSFVCFVLVVVLLVLFLERIHANLRQRDQHLADLRQQAAEEDHIVRMGLLASGAAHEVGTPLATLSVILGDWRHAPEIAQHPERREELAEMETELKRIKGIVSGILMTAGEARGEATELTTAARFLEDLVREWRARSPQARLEYTVLEPLDAAAFSRTPIVAGPALRQVIFNVLDNARDASPAGLALQAQCDSGLLALTVRDQGPGFTAEMLANLGKPYHSTKGRPGGGLGLFLVVNVLRKLGGSVQAANGEHGGAVVSLSLPFSALAIEAPEPEELP